MTTTYQIKITSTTFPYTNALQTAQWKKKIFPPHQIVSCNVYVFHSFKLHLFHIVETPLILTTLDLLHRNIYLSVFLFVYVCVFVCAVFFLCFVYQTQSLKSENLENLVYATNEH